MFTHLTCNIKKSYSLKVFRYWRKSHQKKSFKKLPISQKLIKVFQNSNFCVKAWILSLATNTVIFICSESHFSPFWENVCRTTKCEWLQFFQVKKLFHEKKQLVHFTIQLHKSFSSRQPTNFSLQKCLIKTSHVIEQHIKKTYIQGLKFD